MGARTKVQEMNQLEEHAHLRQCQASGYRGFVAEIHIGMPPFFLLGTSSVDLEATTFLAPLRIPWGLLGRGGCGRI
jgi:hypothetical protein